VEPVIVIFEQDFSGRLDLPGRMSMLKTTVLHDKHVALKAKMAEFAGFDMPIQYTGIVEEHLSVRRAVGVFDVSHMGNFFIQGDGAERFLQRMLTLDIGKVRSGQAVYTLLCYENGGAVDDLILYAFRPNDYTLIVNAANVQKDFEWLKDHKTESCTLLDRSEELSILAVQGPNAAPLMDGLAQGGFSGLKPFTVAQRLGVAGHPSCVARTGYTGEDGCEIIVENGRAPAIWDALLSAGAKPIGLGARDTLRLEMGYTLYGHEINAETNVIEAGLAWVVNLDKKEDFIGKAALLETVQKGLKHKLVGLLAEGKGLIPRSGCAVYFEGRKAGTVTSGGPSPMLGKGIALASLDIGASALGNLVEADVRGKRVPMKVVKRKFV
jgi:aminomethyltransferase